MKSERINVCLTSDNGYAEHMYITTYSMLTNLNKKREITIYILDSGLSKEVHKMFNKLESSFSNSKIIFISINENKYKNYRPMNNTYQPYFRIDIPYLLPELQKIIYLDVDIVVTGDISKLYDIDINKYAIGATTNWNNYDAYYKGLGIPSKYGYFNNGVMLMNLDYFRNNELSQKIINYISIAKKNYFWDQDAFNYVLRDKRLEIPEIYNVKGDHILMKNKPIIIHYAGTKPWKRYCLHPYRYLYHKYRKMSGLQKVKYSENFKFRTYINSLIAQFTSYMNFYKNEINHNKKLQGTK